MDKEFLLPGEFKIVKKPHILSTLLGSCVGISFHNRHTGWAALNHYKLAQAPAGTKDIGKFGDSSIHKIVNTLFGIDPKPTHYTCRIFGGADVIGHLGGGTTIGQKNIDIAEKILHEYKLPIIGRDVGGRKGRRIDFDTSKNLVNSRLAGIKEEEEKQTKTKVLVVDDSAIVRKILTNAINSTDDLQVVGEAIDPFDARDKIIALDPDVISLDLIMPKMNGLDFLKRLSKSFPKPVVIVSTIAKVGSEIEKKGKDYGAMEIVDKDKPGDIQRSTNN